MPPHNIPLASNFKVCTRCGISKPATSEFFFCEKRASDGLCSDCKECRAERQRVYYAANKERAAEYGRAHYATNKERVAEYARVYYAAHKEQQAEYRKARYAAHKEQAIKESRAWAVANPEKRRASHRRRRARKLAAEGSHTAADVAAQYKAQRGRCYYAACGHSKLGEKYHVDHVIPLARGGSNGPENIVIACPTCNLRKNDKLPHEWPEGGRLI